MKQQLALRGAVERQVMLLFTAVALTLVFPAQASLTAMFLHRQDIILVALGLMLLALCGWRLTPRSAPLVGHRLLLPGALLSLFIICLVGHYLVLCGYDMSRDEQMASFDAAVFRSGHLVYSLAAIWRDSADALNTTFMYPAEMRGAWISAYLPGNAVLHALIGSLTGPLLASVGLFALWGCVRRIWPDDRELPLVAIALYVGSGQILMTGMTSYAMNGHLALNMVWLWLFLGNDRRSDMLALVVGFCATGLHQPLMHPMFVAPILCLCMLNRQWHRVALYGIGYAMIGAFWLWWPERMWELVQANPHAVQPEGVDYISRLIQTVRDGGSARVPNMMANLLRFAAWQHLLFLPLLIFGIRGSRGGQLIAALTAGLGLTILVMFAILAYQGHGFGYRYLHGLIGNCILIALFGWKRISARLGQWRPLLIRTSLAGLAVLLPVQALMAHEFYAPFARASARIDTIDADYVVIDPESAPFAQDIVINRPDLSNRPIRLDSTGLTPQLIARLCLSDARVVLVGDKPLADIYGYFGLPTGGLATKHNAVLAKIFVKAGCRVGEIR